MPSLNEVRVMGHLVRNPEVRFTPSGRAVSNFAIATSYSSGEKLETEFHSCVIWNSERIPWAEQTSKLHKGDLVYAEGRLKSRAWKTQDGSERRITEVQCSRVDFLRSPRGPSDQN